MTQTIRGRVKSIEFSIDGAWVDITQHIKYFEISTLDKFEKWLLIGTPFQAIFISEDGTARMRVNFLPKEEESKEDA